MLFIEKRHESPILSGLARLELMLAKSLIALAASSALGCSDDTTQAAGSGSAGAAGAGPTGNTSGDAAIVPATLEVRARPGINSVFEVIALTLRSGSNGPELYAAVKNAGDILACNASFSVELRDNDEQVVGNGISGLMVRGFYLFTDGSGTVAACVPAGEVTMVAITSLTLDAPFEDVRSVVYQSNYWTNLNIAAVDGVTLADVKFVTRDNGVAYSGTLQNRLDTSLDNPTVAVFPINAAGRPLRVAYGGSSLSLPPAGTWHFETNVIDEPGVDFKAFPMGGP